MSNRKPIGAEIEKLAEARAKMQQAYQLLEDAQDILNDLENRRYEFPQAPGSYLYSGKRVIGEALESADYYLKGGN